MGYYLLIFFSKTIVKKEQSPEVEHRVSTVLPDVDTHCFQRVDSERTERKPSRSPTDASQ